VRALRVKLFRDIWQMRGAVFTIALVVASGVAAFVTLRGTWLSILRARDRYYSADRFGDVFAQLERAPQSLTQDLEAMPDVARVYTRVTGFARVPLPNLDEPAQAQIVSIPEDGRPPINGLRLISGRLPSPDRDDEAVLVEMFAQKHGVHPGQVLDVIIEGRERALRVVGLGMSPEFVLSVPNGAQAPAPERFAVLWMTRKAAEAAYDMRGAFNSVVMKLAPGAKPEATIQRLDGLLDRYGSLGAYGRDRQLSNYFLTQDMAQLATMATLAPVIFLGVAAFLLNVVLSRLIELDRPQIATLKAVGYTDLEVGLHYLELTLLIAVTGAGLGLGTGAWLGRGLTSLYVKFYRMPGLGFHLSSELAASAVLASLAAGVAGSFLAVRRVVILPPAEAMRPAAPPSYRRGRLSAALLSGMGASARMIAREILRRPWRMVLSALGIAAATGILVVGQFFSDAMGFLVDFYMQRAQRESLAVNFVAPVPQEAVHALRTLPGVRDVQWQRALSVRVRAGHRDRNVVLMGHGARHSLRPLLDADGREVPLQPGDVILTETLAKILDVSPGDRVLIEPLQGNRTPRLLTMTGTLSELMGLWVRTSGELMHDVLGEAPAATDAMLLVDSDKLAEVQRRIADMPQVASVLRKDLVVAEFRRQTADSMSTFAGVLTAFAVTIALSVVYNNARVSLSMRSRELASLRVLGFTRAEVSQILIGELSVQVLLGIPFGLLFGRALVGTMLSINDPEAFRFPAFVSHHTYAFAALVTACAAAASALLVRKKLDRLDLIEVLKTRE
jgi:putative ABC transport system permease protein